MKKRDDLSDWTLLASDTRTTEAFEYASSKSLHPIPRRPSSGMKRISDPVQLEQRMLFIEKVQESLLDAWAQISDAAEKWEKSASLTLKELKKEYLKEPNKWASGFGIKTADEYIRFVHSEAKEHRLMANVALRRLQLIMGERMRTLTMMDDLYVHLYGRGTKSHTRTRIHLAVKIAVEKELRRKPSLNKSKAISLVAEGMGKEPETIRAAYYYKSKL